LRCALYTHRFGVGVERWDFTKGIVERFHALETLLERHPEWRGRLTFLQVAAPSRSKLPAYQALQEHTLREMDRINLRFGRGGWQPIVLIGEHQEPTQVFELYRAADFCLVNSLHDGMNWCPRNSSRHGTTKTASLSSAILPASDAEGGAAMQPARPVRGAP
jgi:trehalose-6-phosphate synthase